jgi:hypothetical protein
MKESANWNTTDPKRTLMSRVKHTKTPALLGPPLPPLEYMAVEQSNGLLMNEGMMAGMGRDFMK